MPWVPIIKDNSTPYQEAVAAKIMQQLSTPTVNAAPVQAPQAINPNEELLNRAQNRALTGGLVGGAGALTLLMASVGKLPAWAKWGAGGLIVSSLGLFYSAYQNAKLTGQAATDKIKNWIKVPFYQPNSSPMPEQQNSSQLALLDMISQKATQQYNALSRLGKTLFDNVRFPAN